MTVAEGYDSARRIADTTPPPPHRQRPTRTYAIVPERERSRTRLLLCGSAMSFMGRLLAGNAPLRGRAGLELMVRTLDHQLARTFWGIEDAALALKVNAIVGGTPAYRRELVRDDVPAGPADFDAWVERTVLGPHFERVCRYWTRHLAPPELFGDYPNDVRAGTVHDPAAKTGHEVDLVVSGLAEDHRRPILALGEARWGETMGLGHLDRLDRIRGLLTRQGRHGAQTAKLACYAGAGFTADLRAEARRRSDVVLVGLPDLYS